MKRCLAFLPRLIASGVLLSGLSRVAAAVDGGVEARLEEIVRQNQKLQEQVAAQQRTIEALSAEVAAMRGASVRQGEELQALQERTPTVPAAGTTRSQGAVRLSGSVGLAFFRTGSAGPFPNSEFRVDDAKVFLEASVRRNVYAVAELNLMTREANDEAMYLGEMYAEVENLTGAWGHPDLVNLRAGRINIPFGEEYLQRGVMANPLILHSLSDIWGVDEGVELYGRAGKFDYVVAVQNGGHSMLRDFNSDKAVVGRLGFAPNRWLRLSASAMSTGDLGKADAMSEVWFGSAFFRSIGGATTQTYTAELAEVDAVARWASGHLAGAVGRARYVDDDRAADNTRNFDYYYLEGQQGIGESFYGVARYSAIDAPRGYPLVGGGTFGTYFYSGLLTERLDRLSLGFGYRFGEPMVLKFEYAIERGRLTTGRERDHEDFLGTEFGVKF